MSRKLSLKKKYETLLEITEPIESFSNRRAKSYPEALLRESLLKPNKAKSTDDDGSVEDVNEEEIRTPNVYPKRLNSCGQFQNALVTLAIREKDNIQLWRLLSRKDVNINHIDGLGMQPIHYACLYGDIEILKTLLQHNAGINSSTRLGDCPLDIAVREGNFEIAQYLICKGARVNSIINGIRSFPPIKQRPFSYSGSLLNKFETRARKISYEI